VSFASPPLVLALLAVPVALGAYWLAQKRRRRYVVRFPAAPTLAALLDPAPRWRKHAPAALFALALAALAIALARPQATVGVPVERASVVLVTDVSGSMAATDVDPSRLDAAKAAARSFLDRVPQQLRVGLVAFSTSPHTTSAPTETHDEVRAAIEGLNADGATVTGDGLAAALKLINERDDERRRPPAAVVLLSDGKTTDGRDPVGVAREAKRLSVPIYTVSLGTDEGTVPGGPFSERIPVPPDPETMREIASESGGRAFTAEDAVQLDTVYERLGSQIGSKQEKREITAGFAAGGIALLAAALALSLRNFGRLP
jgi:Ca-activated chloride channel homolog